MNLPDNLLHNLESEEDLNSAMAEAQVLMAGASGPVAAAGAEAAEESTSEVLTAEPTEYITSIEAQRHLLYLKDLLPMQQKNH
jgi:hypothetical protein